MSEEVKNNEFTFENPAYRQTYWHTCSHVMAQAVKRLWPEVKLAIGPPSTRAGNDLTPSPSRRSNRRRSRQRCGRSARRS
ncbi:MAG: hypothetical protein ACLTYN_10930 [Dysosmobacter welbionis]